MFVTIDDTNNLLYVSDYCGELNNTGVQLCEQKKNTVGETVIIIRVLFSVWANNKLFRYSSFDYLIDTDEHIQL
jgi:hypothetical protein